MNPKFRQQIGNYLFQKELKRTGRTAEIIPFTKVKTIGILYNATSDQDYEIIKNYVRDLRSKAKEVLALGYVDSKKLPENRMMKLGLDFFTRKALNWKMKPGSTIVNNFISKDFDILICLNPENDLPLKYLSVFTKAKFKIGRYDRQNTRILDFMLSVEETTGLPGLIEQVNHYLNIIKNDQYQEA
jgi:hypothetical protein